MWSCGERAWRRRGTVLLGGILLSLTLFARPAAAHAVLVSSEPPDGATAARAPGVVQLRFSEDVSQRFSSARLVDRDGRGVGGARVDSARGGSRLLVLALPPLEAGAYGVLWQVLAEDDGHTTSGVVVFNVGEGSRSALRPSAAGGGEAVARPADVARRWVGVCLLAGLIGALAVAGLVLGRAGSTHPSEPLAVAIRTARRRLLTLATCCAGLGAVVGVADAVARAARQAPAAGGSPATVAQLLAATRWGHLWLVRELALLVLAVLALRLRSTIAPTHRRDARVLAAGAAALVLAVVSVEAIGSHAAAVDGARAAAVAADALHILTACLWLGALPALVVSLWPQPRGGAGPADLLMASRGALTGLAAGSVGLVVVTGLYSAGREVETVDGLLTTPYGRVLLVKSTLLLVVGGLGLVNAARLHGRPSGWLGPLSGRIASRRPSRRLVVMEAGAGALLLVAVGVLLETVPARAPARVAAAATPAAAETASGSVADLVVTVSVTPNRPGVNGFTVLAASSRRPPPAPVEGVALELTRGGDSSARGGDSSALALQQVAPGRWFGTGSLDQSGSLRLRAVLRRAGVRLAVPLSWWVGPPVPAQRLVPAPGRRLAPWVDGMALSLLAGALALGAWRLVLARRRRYVLDVVHPTQPLERVPEGMR
jgi:copper transport protein